MSRIGWDAYDAALADADKWSQNLATSLEQETREPGRWQWEKLGSQAWEIRHRNGYGISILARHGIVSTRRVEIGPLWPYITHDVARPTMERIRAGIDVDTSKVARRIKREFLPLYLDKYQQLQKQLEEAAKNAASQKEAVEKLLAIIPDSRTRASSPGLNADEIRIYGIRGYGDIHVNDNGTGVTKLELRYLSLEDAMHILHYLKDRI